MLHALFGNYFVIGIFVPVLVLMRPHDTLLTSIMDKSVILIWRIRIYELG